ncbi:hypothetical protein V6Z11_A10G143200 [Gossypium hirsutum]
MMEILQMNKKMGTSCEISFISGKCFLLLGVDSRLDYLQ